MLPCRRSLPARTVPTITARRRRAVRGRACDWEGWSEDWEVHAPHAGLPPAHLAPGCSGCLFPWLGLHLVPYFLMPPLFSLLPLRHSKGTLFANSAHSIGPFPLVLGCHPGHLNQPYLRRYVQVAGRPKHRAARGGDVEEHAAGQGPLGCAPIRAVAVQNWRMHT
jgi:hypothetical protein